MKINLFEKELRFFFKRVAKIRTGKLPAKFCCWFYSHLAHKVFTIHTQTINSISQQLNEIQAVREAH
jgi:hypothetical protein